MRMHKFKTISEGEVWINLDQVTAVCQSARNPDCCSVIASGTWHSVSARVDDVLALISPPAAPDTYEEELALIKREAEARRPTVQGVMDDVGQPVPLTSDGPWLNRAMVDQEVAAAIRAARLDELERTMGAVLGRSEAYWPLWAKDILEKRRHDISMGKF